MILYLLALSALGNVREDDIMISLYEETLEENLGLEPGTWQLWAKASSRGDCSNSMDLLQRACETSNGDLSPWGELLESYGVFLDGKATPEKQNVKVSDAKCILCS